MSSTYGRFFRVTTFGESHGEGIGLILDGCPAGLSIQPEDIQFELDRRRPGQSSITTQRKESDRVQILSGIKEGVSLGTPIGMFIPNADQRPQAYDNLKRLFRPSHADFTYQARYGVRDERGGGRSSNRESAARVAAGAVAKKMIGELARIEVLAWVSRIHEIEAELDPERISLEQVESNPVRCPHPETARRMEEAIGRARDEGDSLGGVVSFAVKNCPPGLGSPVFDKLTADMAKALISINATRFFEIGIGGKSIGMKGSQHNDEFVAKNGRVGTGTNRAGGVLGGISNGETIYGSVAFKPTATILREQKTVDSQGNETVFKARGRHDPCVLPRAVPIVEAMLRLTLADQLMDFCLASMDRLRKALG